MIVGGADGTVSVWDIATGALVRQMRGHTKKVCLFFFNFLQINYLSLHPLLNSLYIITNI